MSNIIIFPDYAKLKDEVAKLKKELVSAINERDELIAVVCPNIEMQYMLLFGDIEYKALNIELAYRRIKRKAELIIARKNMGEKVNFVEIEKELDEELKEFLEKLEETLDGINRSLSRSKGERMSAESRERFKSMYREIVRKLHPDLHPGESSEQLELFFRAVEAYRNGDSAAMKFIYAIVCDEAEKENQSTITQLSEERDRLIEAVRVTNEDIAAIKGRFPYTMKELLSDDEKIAEKKRTLEKAIFDYKISIKTYEKEINELLGR